MFHFDMRDAKNGKEGVFRFTYFTDKYDETYTFYRDKLGLTLAHAWDRHEQDRGALFNAGSGLIEILHRPDNDKFQYAGLDYREPQGVFMCIQVWNVNELYDQFKTNGIPFKKEIMDQPWGHRTFYIQEPNGLILAFYQEQF